jgi:hypothetical protein
MIYIIHFETPYFHARHYVGYCKDGNLESRLARHRAGLGSRLMLAIELAGIDYTIAVTHTGDRTFERKLKRAKNTPRFCPLCRPQQASGTVARSSPKS